MQRALLAYIIFFLSGAAGLGYEVVWTRMFAIGLGHEVASMLAVVAAFFGGLALGGWWFDGIVSRSRVPGRWYALFECIIAVWGIATLVIVPQANVLAATMIGVEPSPAQHWLIAFGIPFIAILPATIAMGATFPAMERLVVRLRSRGGLVGGLYAANTIGAVVGVLCATFLLMPAIGFASTIILFAAANLVCAAVMVLGPATGERKRAEVEHLFDDPPSQSRLRVTLIATGALGIGYEVLAVRVMSQTLENTVYTFAIALAMYLIGSAVGAALYQRLVRKHVFGPTLVWLVQGLAIAGLFGVLILSVSRHVDALFRPFFGGGAAGALTAEVVLSALVFAPITILMGATFSHLVQAARRMDRGVGRAIALNTLGATVSPLIFGVALFSLLGSKWSLMITAMGYLALIPPRAATAKRLVPAAVAGGFVVGLIPANLVIVDVPDGMVVRAAREGVMASVFVLEDVRTPIAPGDTPGRVLKVNNRFQMGGSAMSFADKRQGHLPLLLHGNPRSALFLGVGTGITAGVAAEYAEVEVHAVELVPEVIDVLPFFAPANNHDQLPPDTWHIADARRYVRAIDRQYDVIVADLFHPGRDGAGGLYTREHFQAVRARLASGGLFCQWLPLHQMDMETFRSIAATFLDVFPNARAWMAHFNTSTPVIGLTGWAGDASPKFTVRWFDDRLAGETSLATALEAVAITHGLDALGCSLADNASLRAFAEGAPRNIDHHPIVTFRAPWFVYRGGESTQRNMEALLAELSVDVGALTSDDDQEEAYRERLAAYITARNRFLAAQRLQADGDRDAAIDAFIESASISPDFSAGYTIALQMAVNMRQRDPTRARTMLRLLRDANPADPRAAEQLRVLFRE